MFLVSASYYRVPHKHTVILGDATRQTRINGGYQTNGRKTSIGSILICILLQFNTSMYFTGDAKVHTFEYVATSLDVFGLFGCTS